MLPELVDALSKVVASADIPQEQLLEALLKDAESLENLKKTFGAKHTERQSLTNTVIAGSRRSQQLQRLRASHALERSLPCVKVPPKRRKEAMLGFVIKDIEVQSDERTYMWTVIGMEWNFSQCKLDNLERVSLQNMLARKTHKERYFLGRVVSDVSKVLAISFFLEDPEGHATLVSIYNYPTTFYGKADAQSIFSQGSVWAVREPTYKFPAHGQKNPMIRIDSPSDILPIAPGDKIMRSVRWLAGSTPQVPRCPASVEECRMKGAQEFKAKRFLCAAIHYTDGLMLDDSSIIMRLNRSETYIRLGWYNSAFLDADGVLRDGHKDTNVFRKGIYRAAKSSYMMGEYQRAADYAGRLPDDKDCAVLLTKSRERVCEKETGQFDWCTLLHDSQAEKAYRPDVADFCGSVEVKRRQSDSDRGLFAIRDIEIGELLLASKPLASYYPEEAPISQRGPLESFNLLTDEVSGREKPALISALAQKMWDDERLSSLIKSMYAGSGVSPPEPYRTSQNIVNKGLSHPLIPNVDIDISRLERVVSFNSFGLERTVPPSPPRLSGASIYGVASFCNHSCIPSARRAFFGDLITLRATRPIKAGEEITLEYLSGDAPLRAREKLLHWQFDCDCLLCEADRADGDAERSLRDQLLKELNPASLSPEVATKKLSKIKQTYKDTPERRACGTKPALATAYYCYAMALMNRARKERSPICIESIEALMDCLEAIGMKVSCRIISGPLISHELPIDVGYGPTHDPSLCTSAVLQIIQAFIALRESEKAKIWMKAASWINNITFGGGHEMFKMQYAPILEEMQLSAIAAQVH